MLLSCNVSNADPMQRASIYESQFFTKIVIFLRSRTGDIARTRAIAPSENGVRNARALPEHRTQLREGGIGGMIVTFSDQKIKGLQFMRIAVLL